jgi:hypothetical protein
MAPANFSFTGLRLRVQTGGAGSSVKGGIWANSPVTNIEQRLRVRPTASFDLSERFVLGLDLGYLDVSYDQQEANERQDYTSEFARVDLGYELSPKQTITLGAEGGRYDPENGESADTQLIDLKWSNHGSETSQVYLRGGANRVETTDINGTQWETGFSGGAGVRWSMRLTYSSMRLLAGSSSSGRIVVDQLRVRWERQLSGSRAVPGARGIHDDQPDDVRHRT